MKVWRVGRRVPINVYAENRPVCQCHNPYDAARIVAAVNAAEFRRRELIAQDKATGRWKGVKK